MKDKSSIPFSEKHPTIYSLLGLGILVVLIVASVHILSIVVSKIALGLGYLLKIFPKLDAVIIVAIITGGVSLFGVFINSIVSKTVEYNRTRQEYLAKKREVPYGDFVDMVYKIMQESKSNGSYDQDQMIQDLSKFSKQITLWGSSNVVKKWVAFRENGGKPEFAQNNIFLLEDIMNEMRKDLGVGKVKKGNLLAFFINDIKNAKVRNKHS